MILKLMSRTNHVAMYENVSHFMRYPSKIKFKYIDDKETVEKEFSSDIISEVTIYSNSFVEKHSEKIPLPNTAVEPAKELREEEE